MTLGSNQIPAVSLCSRFSAVLKAWYGVLVFAPTAMGCCVDQATDGCMYGVSVAGGLHA